MPRADPDALLRPVDLGLTQDERRFIIDGLAQWGGPARARHEPAVLAGFTNAEEMDSGTERFQRALESEEPLSREDWRRVVVLTEVIFGSDTFGAGVEWETVTGRDEVTDLRLLREVQRKLVAVSPSPG